MRRALAVVVCALVCVAPAYGATSAQVRALARQAATSSSALERLRAIRVVDGRPLAVARALRTSDRTTLRARLRVLAAPPGNASPLFPARAQARRVLSARRFRGSSVPRPFHGALVWVGDKLSPVTRAIHRLGRHVPGGSWTIWVVLAGIVVALSATVAGRTARRRGALELERSPRGDRQVRLDPRELEREAEEAERAGDSARAVRLRFRAGLLRLGRARVVPLRASLTSGEARRIIRLAEFDALARTHDEVVYGGRPALREDVTVARERWPRVLEAKGVRP